MKRAAATAPGLKVVRALLIVGALVSLCASDRVGPRLLPLTAPQSFAGGTQSFTIASDGVLPTPVPGDGSGARVAMAAPAPFRTGAGERDEQPATHAAPAAAAPVNLVFEAAVASYLSPAPSRPVSVPAGRGPPCLA